MMSVLDADEHTGQQIKIHLFSHLCCMHESFKKGDVRYGNIVFGFVSYRIVHTVEMCPPENFQYQWQISIPQINMHTTDESKSLSSRKQSTFRSPKTHTHIHTVCLLHEIYIGRKWQNRSI